MYARVLKPLLFGLSPERAHRAAVLSLALGASVPPIRRLIERATLVHDPALEVRAFGLTFRNPVGLAAGFDKNAGYALSLRHLGFGFLEVGSITARSVEGNPRPRLFRLPADAALVNRMGLNNEGATRIAGRLSRIRARIDVPLFANVALTPGVTTDTDGAIGEYVTAVRAVQGHADAIVLNVSCPNTGDGRSFEDPELLAALLAGVRAAMGPGSCPLLVKLSSDPAPEQLREAVAVACERADGLVISNTTLDRSDLTTPPGTLDRIGAGSVSGRPLRARALEALALASGVSRGRCPIVGVGGIASAEHAREFLEAGAVLVELYTGLVYEGPMLVRRIAEGLAADSAPYRSPSRPNRATSSVTDAPARTRPSEPAT